MLSRVLIQPDSGRNDLESTVRDAWQAFEIAIPNHPLANIPATCGMANDERIDGAIAIAMPELNQLGDQVERGRIVLASERFWEAEYSDDDRMLTLLHESIHLRLADTMTARTVRNAILRRQAEDGKNHAFNTEACDIAMFKHRRGIAAFDFYLFPEEAWAEIHLRDHYPDWFERRLIGLLAMRVRNRARRDALLVGLPEPLVRCLTIFEIVRTDFVIALERDQSRLAQLDQLKQEWLDDLGQLCRHNPLQAPLSTFADAIPRPLVAGNVSEARFDEYRQAVLAIPPP